MRIAVFIKKTTFHKNYGGFETQNKVLCEGLARKGHKVTVFSPKLGVKQDKITDSKVNYVFVPCIYKKFSVLYSKNQDSWLNKSESYFEKYNSKRAFDLVISQSAGGLGVIKKKSKYKIPIVAVSHGSKISEAQSRLKSLYAPDDYIRFIVDIPHILRAFFVTQREFIHGSDKVIAVSNYVKHALIEETFVEDSKVTVIHNGIDPKDIKYVKKKHHRHKKLLYIGRLEASKGLQVLLKSLKAPALKNVHLEIVGSGPFSAQLENLVKKGKLGKRVNFTGKVPYEKVLEEYKKADIFVLPTLRVEGFPMTIVEAMFAGLPVVASNIGGNSDAIEPGSTGFLLTPGRTKELASALEELINSDKMLMKMGKNGRLKAEREYTAEIMVEKYLEVFEKVIQK